MASERTPKNHPGELLIPSGASIIGFHLHTPYWLESPGVYTGDLPQSYVVGQQTVNYRLFAKNQKTEIFGLALIPNAIWKLFKIPAYTLTNQPKDFYSVIAPKFHPLLRQINDSPELPLKRELALQFLQELQEGIPKTRGIVDFALELIVQNKGCISTRDLCKELHVSERHLQHLFRLEVGVSPLQYARITRFNSIFAEFAKSEEPKDIPFLVSFFNYYDLSHFSRDFRSFCGDPPSNFHLENFHLLKELVEKDPYLIQVQKNYPQNGNGGFLH